MFWSLLKCFPSVFFPLQIPVYSEYQCLWGTRQKKFSLLSVQQDCTHSGIVVPYNLTFLLFLQSFPDFGRIWWALLQPVCSSRTQTHSHNTINYVMWQFPYLVTIFSFTELFKTKLGLLGENEDDNYLIAFLLKVSLLC